MISQDYFNQKERVTISLTLSFYLEISGSLHGKQAETNSSYISRDARLENIENFRPCVFSYIIVKRIRVNELPVRYLKLYSSIIISYSLLFEFHQKVYV